MKSPEENKKLVLEAFDKLFNKRDYAKAAEFWSENYIQHSAHIAPGRDGLFNLVRSLPDTLRYENALILAQGDYLILHGRFTGSGRPRAWVAADIVRMENGRLAEHWDVLQDEATKEESVSGLPMFGTSFAEPDLQTQTAPPTASTPASNHTHETAPTKFVEANGIRYAYRRLGKAGAIPLLFLGYFNSNMDTWDPKVINAIARDHEVILFDNAGVGASGGETPATVEEMTEHCVAFCRALDLQSVDVVGFSLGGMIAQQLALAHPRLVRRLILLGTGPQGGEGMTFTELSPEEQADPVAFLLAAFFAPSEASQRAGRDYLKRLESRTKDLDLTVSRSSAVAQLAAIRTWGTIPKTGRYASLKNIVHPTLIVHGNKDVVVAPINALILAEHLPNAELMVYSDSSHGAQYQHAEMFLEHLKVFYDQHG